jgi:hypothetical protein
MSLPKKLEIKIMKLVIIAGGTRTIGIEYEN